jgi:hypothetical protein
MELLNDITKINSLLNDVWNFQLVIFGLSVTLFTLLYSFIIVKREELKNISNQIKSNQSQPSTFQKESFAKNYIIKLKKINQKLLILIVVSFVTSFFGWVVERFVSDCSIELKRNLMLMLSIFTFIILILVFIQFKKIHKDYIENTKF